MTRNNCATTREAAVEILALNIERVSADPVTWKVTVPSGSITAATKIHQALHEHIGDLVTLANKLGDAADEPQLVIHTRTRRKR